MCLAEITLFNRRSGEAERMILVDFKKALQGGAIDQMIMSTLSVFEQKLCDNGSFWHNHFKTLAEPIQNSTYDSKHQKLCDVDYQAIKYLCNQASPRIVIKSELIEAIKSINTGKSEDIFGLSIEHILNAGDDFTDYLLYLVNIIIHDKLIPEIIKLGLLSPIFKNKGSKNDSKNYRGIVVLPILFKLQLCLHIFISIEALIRSTHDNH
ncbi:unnamed protein product [Mytilus coruscus]|uniref:Uncharacterized protein n=1 Tax=Mytilus coruscus TaxID=42192 RepID=A0A6J8B3B4_MYTCO|nr:unnamed protein product [Mytilus coruscus]